MSFIFKTKFQQTNTLKIVVDMHNRYYYNKLCWKMNPEQHTKEYIKLSNVNTTSTIESPPSHKTHWYIDYVILIAKYGISSIIKYAIFIIIAITILKTNDLKLKLFSLLTFILPTTLDNAILTIKSAKELYSVLIVIQFIVLILLFAGSIYVIINCLDFDNQVNANDGIIALFTGLTMSNPIIELLFEILYNKRQERNNNYGLSD